MATVVTLKLQHDIKDAIDTWVLLRQEAFDLYSLYWKTTVNSVVGALASGTTPASQQSKLTKTDALNAASLAEVLGTLFFENQAVATADRMVWLQGLTHGLATPTLIDASVEDFCNRSKQLAQDCLTQYQRAGSLINLYNSSELSSMVGSLSSSTLIYGSEMTKDDLTSAITLAQQFKAVFDNSAVTTGDYKVTLGRWGRL